MVGAGGWCTEQRTVGETYLFLVITNEKPALWSSLTALAIRSQLSYLRVMRARSLSILACPP